MVDTPSPEATIAQFRRHMCAADVGGLVSLYEPEAVFVPDDGNEVRGGPALQAFFASIAALRPRLELTITASHRTGDLALVTNAWSLAGTAPDGSAVTKTGRSVVILRRQPTGAWLIAIDHP